MYKEDDLLPISALQHLLFCARQCALIHLEQAWSENLLTAQGRQLHERVHEAGPESRGDVRVVRGLRLCSRRLGLTGQADVVELRPAEEGGPAPHPVRLPGLEGTWTVRPVEYKRGRPKNDPCDRVQLCAQALCLEEMLGTRIPLGALFYARPRRRDTVAFDADLRAQTRDAARRLHELIRAGVTPPAAYSRKCRSCSLRGVCLPKRVGRPRSARLYLNRQLAASFQATASEQSREERS